MRLSELGRAQKVVAVGGFCMAGLIVLLLIAEGAVRVRSYVKTGFWWGVGETYTVDEATGLRIPRPGLNSERITINSAGFRGPEITVAKPAGTVRIAFLGASTTYCAEVSSNAATWPHLVTDGLSEQFPDHDFEYINAGVPGYGADKSLDNLNGRIAAYSPDIIVIYHATNDLSYNSFQAAYEAGIATKRADQDKFWLSRYSLLSRLVELNLKILFLQSQSMDGNDGEKLAADPRELARPFAADMTALIRRSKELASAVAVATFSVQYRRDQTAQRQAAAAATNLYYMPYMTVDGLLDSFAEYNRVIRQLGEAEQVILIEGENEIPGDTAHFNDSVHFKDAGSRAMAGRVVSALADSPEIQRLLAASAD